MIRKPLHYQNAMKNSPSPRGERARVRASVHLISSQIFRPLYTWLMPDVKRARSLRKNPTWAEKLMWSWLRDRRFSAYKFRRGHPLGKYFLDFFCAEANLSIELDGGGHGHPEQCVQDLERTGFLNSMGIKELRFWNSRLRREQQSIRDTIFYELQVRAPHPLPNYTRPIAGSDGNRNRS